MSLFALSFKSDKDLKKYLNSGNIEGNIIENNSDNKNDNIEQNSQIDNLIQNDEKISMGIRDSKATETNIKEERNENKEEVGIEQDKNNVEKEEEIKKDNENANKTFHRKDSIVLDNKRTLFHKIFGPMEAGSIRGSIFNMVILSLGTGMFALPKYMSNTSLFFSGLLIIGICISVWWSLLLLSKACEKNNIYNYSKLIELLYGKFFSIIYDIIVILYSFGVLILLNIIIYTTLGEALYGIYYFKQYKTLEDFKNNSFWKEWYIQILLYY